ncbi:uncharacterized protein GGS22DRAFT_194746 [Annulohypoxylon maeteangense]|uniref:uncharacterized protein n=1 Tax=Annulohypoxylon maeteangense TaxID=1927788 RepID=UPI0020078527|nr:uncharacterized protein GGS22DRAFT_194746 [Annulohypoxylon maeteangense]KAI0884139.1 hypothetical protein GGS22DRAFT_194746 [Annulohypoxylon maeteangense]
MPKSHDWRDIENLGPKDAHLIKSMIELKEKLLKKNCPKVSPADVHTGFHRGRRVLIGNIFWPDIISIHHLHMHVIVGPRFWLKFFKYPPWLSLMVEVRETGRTRTERKFDRQQASTV